MLSMAPHVPFTESKAEGEQAGKQMRLQVHGSSNSNAAPTCNRTVR
jgi:hypothetical protein